MKFTIDPAVIAQFPDIIEAVVIIRGFDNTRGLERAESLLRDAETRLQRSMKKADLDIDIRSTIFFDAFRKTGMDTKTVAPSHVAMARRVLSGKQLPPINPIVSLYNAYSLYHMTPFGGEDLDTVYGDVTLSVAAGGEQWIPIGGGIKPALAGELIWHDAYDVTCRSLNWRQCDRTKLTEHAKNGYFIMDGFESVSRTIIEKASTEFIKAVTDVCGGTAEVFILDADHPEIDVPFVTKTLTLDEKKMLDDRYAKNGSETGSETQSVPTPIDLSTTVQTPIQGTDASPKNGGKNSKKTGVTDPGVIQAVVHSRIPSGVMGEMQMLMIELFQSIGAPGITPMMTRPEFGIHGDYATNAAMIASKALGKPPREIALQVVSKFEMWKKACGAQLKDQTSHKEDQTTSYPASIKQLLQDVDRLEVAGPGFINIFLSEAKMSTQAVSLLKNENGVKSGKKTPDAPKVFVEYTDPNPFKELHIGHLYSNSVGESLARLYAEVGCDVRRADYFGDVGMHVAKSIWGMMHRVDDEKKSIAEWVSEMEGKTLIERSATLGRCYAAGSAAYETSAEEKEVMKDINYYVYIAGQDYMVHTMGWTPHIDYRTYVTMNEETYEKVKALYFAGKSWSMEYFKSIFHHMGTEFDYYFPESIVGETGYQIVQKGLETGIFEKSDGSVIYRGDLEGLHTRVFVNSLGLPTYEAKELGLAVYKHEQFPYDLSIVVTGKEIDDYFDVLMSALSKIRPDLSKITKHIGHGMVRLTSGKMSSRTGQVITGLSLLGEAEEQIQLVMDQSKMNYTKEELSEVSKILAVAAIKYSFLRVSVPNDITFDFKTSININGDSGPYLIYTYARCKSVMRKAEESGYRSSVLDQKNSVLPETVTDDPRSTTHDLNTEERALARHLMYFPEIVGDATKQFSPSILCLYLNQLASLFNALYGKHQILTEQLPNPKSKILNNDQISYNKENIVGIGFSEKSSVDILIQKLPQWAADQTRTSNFRLSLTAATAATLKRGLYLLGIETVERM
jgi:arginyl-tRNA synthetase